MAALKDAYDGVAIHYDVADCFGSLSKSHASALTQLRQISLPAGAHIVDIGLGDGRFLQTLSQHFEPMQYTGIDISPRMLTLAKQAMPDLITIEGTVAEASHALAAHSQDLVLAHFVNAYVPMHVLLEQVSQLLKPNGYFSIITSTYESFPVIQQALAAFSKRKSLWARLVDHYYQKARKQTTVAANQAALLVAFQDHHLTILAHEQLRIPIVLKDSEALIRFGTEGTWFLNTVTAALASKAFLRPWIRSVCEKMLTFPYQDTHLIEVVLVQKRVSSDK